MADVKPRQCNFVPPKTDVFQQFMHKLLARYYKLNFIGLLQKIFMSVNYIANYISQSTIYLSALAQLFLQSCFFFCFFFVFRITLKELQSMLIETKLIINTAPLTYDYPNTIKTYLTPNHLLFGGHLLCYSKLDCSQRSTCSLKHC